ncbi:MAG: cyclic nucleotide-binding domain-containing protein [Sandaracinaceae bacterium]
MTVLSSIPPHGRALSEVERLALLEDLAAIVESSHLFKSLDDQGRRDLLASGYVMVVPNDEVLIREGDEGTAMYLIMEGRVRVETVGPTGTIRLAELSRGACLGEVSVLSGSPRTATVTTLTELKVVAFETHRVHRLLDDYPRVRKVLEALVEGRARDAAEKIIGS